MPKGAKNSSYSTTTTGKQSADQIAADVAQQEEERYQELYRPLNQELMQEVDSTELIDDAKGIAAQASSDQEARRKRNLARYGVSLDQLGQQEVARANKSNTALTLDTAVNQAADAQDQLNTNLQNELINIGRGISQSGQQGLTLAANLETQRNNYNSQLEAQQDAAASSLFGGVGSMMLLSGNPLGLPIMVMGSLFR